MAAIIELRDVTKRYGDLTAVDGLNLTIEEGGVFGFIGPNGAGKTTTMRILTTLLRPTSGGAWIAGHSVIHEPLAVRRVIGYMPDFFGVYEDMKVWEYLDFFAACYNISPAARSGMIDDLLALVELSSKRDAYVETLSRGMKQRLCLARTLTHDPRVLILDEPASGLDPRARIEMRELLRELQNMGKTIFFSSHILSEVADICTSIGIIENGRLVAVGNVEEMMSRLRAHRLITVRFVSGAAVDPAEVAAWVGGEPGVLSVTTGAADLAVGSLRFDFSGDDAALSGLLARMIGRGLPVLSFSEEKGDLEDVFMQVTQGIAD
jgi:ABC-2 type transport system ATP-binding protein